MAAQNRLQQPGGQAQVSRVCGFRFDLGLLGDPMNVGFAEEGSMMVLREFLVDVVGVHALWTGGQGFFFHYGD